MVKVKKMRWWLVGGGILVFVYLLGFLFFRVLGIPIPAAGIGKPYVACGCGCCGGYAGGSSTCVYSKLELDAIKERDQKLGSSKECAFMGCSGGVKYKLCKRDGWWMVSRMYGLGNKGG